MRNLLIGNGVIIQFGGGAYLNSSIINRALTNIHSGQFPSHIYPKECADCIQDLHGEHAKVLRGHYDKYTLTSYDRSALKNFKKRYEADRFYAVDEIGLEDYFLLFELVHNKLRIGNPNRFTCRSVLKRMFLDAVYNGGQIEEVNQNFSLKFVAWLKEHDQIFTTNYDSNIEVAYCKEVFHLHGSFQTLSETYDPNSFRNQLKDDLLDGEKVDPDFLYLYSNCLLSYTGYLKSSSMVQSIQANNGMEKMAIAYKENPEIRKQIDKLGDSNNELTKRLTEAIKLKVNNPELKHREEYHQETFELMTGSLIILGLSANNDNHIFNQILSNDKVTEIQFYYYDPKEAEDAEKIFHSKNIATKDVSNLWVELK